MKQKKKKYIKARHKFYYWFLRPVVRIIAWKYHFKAKRKKLKKGEQYLILSNHQSYLEPAFMVLTFKRPVFFVASDALQSQKWYSKLLFHCFAPIPKRRGFTDVHAIKTMCSIAREGGSVAVFPEGNRQWCDFQFYIDKSIVKLIRLIKLPVALYNFHGGYGVGARWAHKLRKGKHVGEVKRILTWEEICQMDDDTLYREVIAGLKVIDSDSGQRYRSKIRAEYLERQLFVCPKCHSHSALHSKGTKITCTSCGFTATYEENLHLSSPDPDFAFDKVVDWWQFQQREVENFEIAPGKVLAQDENVQLFDKTTQERKLLAAGKLTLTDTSLTVGEYAIPTDQIYGGCAQDGTKLTFNVDGISYMVMGNERFNAVKYCFFFNRVCKQIADAGGDKFYGLHLDPNQL